MEAIRTSRFTYRAFFIVLEEFDNGLFKATATRNDSSKVVETGIAECEREAIDWVEVLLDEFLDEPVS